MPSRRDVLAGLSAAGAAGLAGCSGGSFSPGRDGSTEWPVPGYNVRGTNYARNAAAPRTKPSERWSAKTGLAVGRIVVADGAVLVPAADALYAFDVRSGDERWRVPLKPYGVAVADGVAFVTLRDEPAVVALATADGSEQWRTETAGQFGSAPLPAPTSDVVFAGDTTGRVTALSQQEGARRWSFDAFTGVYSLAARGERLYVGTTGGTAYELHASGDAVTPVWRRKIPGTVRGLAVQNDSVYVGAFGGGFLRLFGGAHAGRTAWHAPDAPTVTDAVVFTGESVLGADGGGVAAYDADSGSERWRWSADGSSAASAPAAAGDTLYVGVDGRLRAFELGGGTGVGPYRFGAQRWSYDVLPRCVAVADGAVFAAADDVHGSPGVVALE
ncbi:PQQ-binding-like beta-propeller repeat protein [Halobaculum sp. D14]|uniref:outer membrane protein assembly factor BamB family protein n=1 Tax=Halobaculum sp. D14 TaxID=3421642 RepID=UPI003EBE2791